MNYQAIAILGTCLLLTALLSFSLLDVLTTFRWNKKQPQKEFTKSNPLYRAVNYVAFSLLATQMVNYLMDVLKILQIEQEGLELAKSAFSYFAVFFAVVLGVFLLVYLLSRLVVLNVQSSANAPESTPLFTGRTLLYAGVLLSFVILFKTLVAHLFEVMVPNPTIPGFH